MQDDALARELEERVEELGYELVELERAGNRQRPILRLRIDRPGDVADAGVTLDDCARVSRALERELDARDDLSGSYVLEVSSPGIERPLVRPRDWQRFAGREITVRGRVPLARGTNRLDGTLLGLAAESEGAETAALVRLADGEEVHVRLEDVKSANLVHRWG